MGTFQSRKYYYTLITSYYTRHHFNFLFTVNTFIIMRLSTFIYTSLVVISITCSTCYASGRPATPMENTCPVLRRMKTENWNQFARRDSGSDGKVDTASDLCRARKEEYKQAVKDEFEERKDELDNANPGFRQICMKYIRKKHANLILSPKVVFKMEQSNGFDQ